MTPYLIDACQEFKRVEHLLFVSLKYTRTVDVLVSVVDKVISCLGELIKGMLTYAHDNKRCEEVPTNAAAQAELFAKLYPQHELVDISPFFLFLRKLKRLEYKRMNEYRRHVTMTVIFPEIAVNITIDKLNYYYAALKNFIDTTQEIIEPSDD